MKRTTKYSPITEDMIGKIFHRSWGYDMTINDYVRVIDQTPKSLVVKECKVRVENDTGHGQGTAEPTGIKEDGEQFRMFKIQKTWKDYYTGEERTAINWVGGSHTWWLWDGKANYQNSWD